ncbi:MAG TPA: Uma2 family endonuclease [Verrucomicrobiae bacterium]
MAEVLETFEQSPLVIHPIPSHRMDEDEFFEFCQLNHDLRIERSDKGDIIVMAPAGGSSSSRNANLTSQFALWARKDGTGTIFDSSAGFILPNSAVRSPDVAWVLNSRLDELTDEEMDKFLPLCPDFVLKLRSKSDPLRIQKEKMVEYIANGARLGWLIDPVKQQVQVYRPRSAPRLIDAPLELSDERVLPGFKLDLREIWSIPGRARTRSK